LVCLVRIGQRLVLPIKVMEECKKKQSEIRFALYLLTS
jgi:hypothetical protein